MADNRLTCLTKLIKSENDINAYAFKRGTKITIHFFNLTEFKRLVQSAHTFNLKYGKNTNMILLQIFSLTSVKLVWIFMIMDI